MPRTSDLTVGRVRNLIDAAIQKGKFDPDLPFTFFMETTDDRSNSTPSGKAHPEPPRQQVGDGSPHPTGRKAGTTGLPSGGTGGSADRADRFLAEAEAATTTQSTGW